MNRRPDTEATMKTPETIYVAIPVEALPFDQAPPPYRMVPVPVPVEFLHEEALLRLCALLIPILSSGAISERELTKRIIRHHPAQEGV